MWQCCQLNHWPLLVLLITVGWLRQRTMNWCGGGEVGTQTEMNPLSSSGQRSGQGGMEAAQAEAQAVKRWAARQPRQGCRQRQGCGIDNGQSGQRRLGGRNSVVLTHLTLTNIVSRCHITRPHIRPEYDKWLHLSSWSLGQGADMEHFIS